MSTRESSPLVSVGIPSYNRPEGLKRSLEQVLNQTYINLEIIIADNCSENESAIKAVVEPFMKIDKRIKYFRHKKNEGVAYNFKFLLAQATGEYFMWVADDDERHPSCIETCLQLIGTQGGAFGTYEVRNRFYNATYRHKVPRIFPEMSLQMRLLKFISVFPSVYIYGLYRRRCLDFFLEEEQLFDFFDGYFAMHILINYGLNVSPTEQSIIVLGVNEKEYVPKPFKRLPGRLFTYSPVLQKCSTDIWNSKQLNIVNKAVILLYFRLVIFKAYITYENGFQNPATVLNIVFRLPLRYLYRIIKRLLIGRKNTLTKT
jgi:glycosyltransferase involved in cell wall biosynthesis